MKRLGLGMALAVLALGGAATSVAAETITFEGCAVSGINGTCTYVNPLNGSYLVNGAKKPVPVKTPIRLTGTVVTGLTMCAVPALTDIKWKKIKKKSC
jgi:hypothetical protein